MVKLHHTGERWVLTLSPNRSANWVQTKLLITTMAFFVLIIALAWTLVGAWLVLPFAGIEVALLWFIAYKVSLYTYQQQVITITATSIELQLGTYRPQKSWTFNKSDTYIALVEAKNAFECIQLRFIDGSRQIIFAEFLNQADRKVALEYLKAVPIRVLSDKWWHA
ncbi:MAG: DUF2244 domain-containing protein [Paraglaciecola polaris]|uniref:DUF2244 domain-containing protein n=1 Tax=Paraglaciecola polaris TaxID=222814 RepID=UPI0030019A35|tara:strand:+ start:151 stop:648 length:498 start_codon:yes stop_codon:yes gene_type:complete